MSEIFSIPVFVAISGGSGAGKSTVCHSLMKEYPERVELIQLDGYFRDEKFVPEKAGMKNRDHPDALDLERLYGDLLDLRQGKSIFVPVKDESQPAESNVLEKRVIVEKFPKEIVLVEGFLCLRHQGIRKIYDKILRLEVDEKTRWDRRVHFKNDEYRKNILDPMFEEFVLPTKKYATEVIDVSDMKKEEVLKQVERCVFDV